MKSWRRLRSWNPAKIDLSREGRRVGVPNFYRARDGGTPSLPQLNPQVRQRVADVVHDLDELRMRFLKTLDGGTQSLQRMVK
jgi:hypothetical protein